MAFLINNLQYYLQVDVIESQFSILCEKVNSVHDFEAIRLAHDHFLTSLLGHSFLFMKPMHHCLTEILSLCTQFTQLMKQDAQLTDEHDQQLKHIQKTFQRQSGLLFTLLSGFRSQQSSPHLAQLLLRIDFNKVFSSAVASHKDLQ
ncbi:hypothetical protein CAPTEDRAFT_198216 [Capitella teleta]|nr:hypothetical protein CAPTEDRAFT_198216 [Capitella teleta]|eukprot:ELT88090.1 hypothetical protein CAPTEDRAFT_198216 [Capitella teleta]